ncbi:MAG: hypothetical protein P8Y70_13495 [Candidatus Lokiarchaeota archaeon]
MTCEECFGVITIAVVSLLIGIFLSSKYAKERNRFTLYMALFFLFAGIGWFILFISTDWVLGIYNSILLFLIIIGFLPQLMLLIFILTFFEVNVIIRVIAVIVSIILIIVHSFFPELRLLTIISTIIIISNIVLFIMNWRKNDDIKSFGFSIGLLLILIGESLLFISRLIQGIMLFIAALIWLFTYSGLLEKVTKK